MDDRLRITAGVEDMALRLQLVTQRLVVPDLAIEDDPDVAGFIGHRLVSTAEVDHAEAPEAQADLVVEVGPAIVGSAVSDQTCHPLDDLGRDRLAAPNVADAADAAHRLLPPVNCALPRRRER
jgi:hypothetical protein